MRKIYREMKILMNIENSPECSSEEKHEDSILRPSPHKIMHCSIPTST